MTTLTPVLPTDTQAVLLLCSAFGQSRQIEPIPLSLGEYNGLAEWLQSQNLRPADLLVSDHQERLRTNLNHGIDVERIIQLLQRGATLAFNVEEWVAKGLWILSRSDAAYPQRLKRKLKRLAPPLLYGTGNQTLLDGGGLAIVGSRNIDHDGLEYTQQVAEKCAEQQIQIISGGARGVDQQAMVASVVGGGTCVGVLADSLIKATVSRKYREGIRNGQVALVSSYDPSAGFHAGNAMSRNKYIYALAEHVLVVNSLYEKGGTWAGATEELKRDNPISIWVRVQGHESEGNRQLQKIGAKPFPNSPWNRHIFSLLADEEKFWIENAGSKTNIADASVSNGGKKGLPQQINIQSVGVDSNPGDSKKEELAITESMKSVSSSVDVEESGYSLSCVPKDAYDCILPLLLSYLQESKHEREIADLLDVTSSQTRKWLQRAVDAGLICKQREKRRVVYGLNQNSKQLPLLSAD